MTISIEDLGTEDDLEIECMILADAGILSFMRTNYRVSIVNSIRQFCENL